MHLSDALISPQVGIVGTIAAGGLIAIAASKIKQTDRTDIVPLMGVMGAFVFVAQMINFTIPGTGSSGHLIGGILLASILGPWCAFLTLCSILIVQCLIFADGGLLALGCNILNMGAASCLVAYPLVFRPVAGQSLKPSRLIIASILASVFALEIGALAVTIETELSGITALPFSTFVKFMLPIHVAIGIVEGIVTAALLIFIAKYRPEILQWNQINPQNKEKRGKLAPLLYVFLSITFILGISFTVLASSNPDGLEWSVDKVAGLENFSDTQPITALMPEYDSNFAGICGALIVMIMIWAVSKLIFSKVLSKKSLK